MEHTISTIYIVFWLNYEVKKLCNADLNGHVLIYIEVLTISHIVLYMAY